LSGDEPVPVSTDDFPIQTDVPVLTLTHTGAWVTGRACRYGQLLHGDIAVQFDEPIKCGTSGGPVIDENGLLVGVISWSNEGQDPRGPIPRPHLALPVWIVKRVIPSPARRRVRR
jgi:S1-C subfamily serine protease